MMNIIVAELCTIIVVVTGYDLGYRIGEMINSFRTKRKETKTEKHHEEPSDATEDFMDRVDSFDKKVFESHKDYVFKTYSQIYSEQNGWAGQEAICSNCVYSYGLMSEFCNAPYKSGKACVGYDKFEAREDML